MKNNKGFTLIELIMVTIILGVLAAVAVPRFMGAVSNSEAAAEAATIAALRSAVENYATQKFLEEGRYSYPANPFEYIEVDGYNGSTDVTTNSMDNDRYNMNDGEWGFVQWNGTKLFTRGMMTTSTFGLTVLLTLLILMVMIGERTLVLHLRILILMVRTTMLKMV